MCFADGCRAIMSVASQDSTTSLTSERTKKWCQHFIIGQIVHRAKIEITCRQFPIWFMFYLCHYLCPHLIYKIPVNILGPTLRAKSWCFFTLYYITPVTSPTMYIIYIHNSARVMKLHKVYYTIGQIQILHKIYFRIGLQRFTT